MVHLALGALLFLAKARKLRELCCVFVKQLGQQSDVGGVLTAQGAFDLKPLAVGKVDVRVD
jgi:hypothetical protein